MLKVQFFPSNVHRAAKLLAAVIAIFLTVLIYFSYTENDLKTVLNPTIRALTFKLPTLLLNTTTCKIPDLDPVNEDVLPYVIKEEYEQCTNKPLLTYVEKRDDVVILKINRTAARLYSYFKVRCCVSDILRRDTDTSIDHSSCQSFEDEYTITYPYIRVTCRNYLGVVYINVHMAILPQKPTVQPAPRKLLNVFMLGIDSISRLNLQRSMPKTFTYLEDNFVGFKGYNKIDDNTFPNLMAVLAGRSEHTWGPDCLRNQSFDNCDLIWNHFKRIGYATAYGEDEPFLNTFNYFKKGFVYPPTDYYMRPYFLSAYQLPMVYKHAMGVCSGPENTAQRIFNGAKDFLVSYAHKPTFSLFWANSFSHDDINAPSGMDDKLITFLDSLNQLSTVNNTIFIVFSDHGFRFGDIRFTYTGWLEERLPFLFIKFPKEFQKSHPELYKNLVFNARNRFTTPYDFHMTLQHLLKLFDDSYEVRASSGCPAAHSLFEPIAENRSCAEACVEQHWCTCQGYHSISTTNDEALIVARYVVDQINALVRTFPPEESQLCATYTLQSIETIGRSLNSTATYLVMLKTYPYAMFEATVTSDGQRFELLGGISRLNRYASYSSCVKNDVLRKYCFCDGWWTKLTSAVCNLFHIY